MKALELLQENYAMGFLAPDEVCNKFIDTLVSVGLDVNLELLKRIDRLNTALDYVRKAYAGYGNEQECIEQCRYALFAPAAGDVMDIINKMREV